MKLYQVKPEWLYGDEKDAQRQVQLDLLASLSLKECPEGYVVCNADQVIQLVSKGYSGKYDIFNHVKEIFDMKSETDVSEVISAAVKSSTEAVARLFNEKTQSETPGLSLMSITQTKLLEDACTDSLQQTLADGWRILAICPQPQRRPDYVLGRQYLPEVALRG